MYSMVPNETLFLFRVSILHTNQANEETILS